MYFKLVMLTICCICSVLTYEYHCSKRAVLKLNKRYSYDFSVKMLRRVDQDTKSHFVYSPLSTWLQLSALAEGATGLTYQEIWNVTRSQKQKCFKRHFSLILNALSNDLGEKSKRQIILAMDKLMGVAKKYMRAVEKFYGVRALLLDFEHPQRAADLVNELTKNGTGGVITNTVYYDDFVSTVLLMSDASYFRSKWKTTFSSETHKQEFHSRLGGIKGEVYMMNQIGYYRIANCSHIGATVLEIPCAIGKIVMLVFLPPDKAWVSDIFYNLEKTTLTSIFNILNREGKKMVNITMPRFKQRSEIDNLYELVYDMGVRRMFDPDLAEFRGISKFKMHASFMTQIADIDVDETGVRASASSLLKNDTVMEFLVNRPFAYMIVDRKTDFILYAGAYSNPSLV